MTYQWPSYQQRGTQTLQKRAGKPLDKFKYRAYDEDKTLAMCML